MNSLQTHEYREKIRQGQYVDGSLDALVDELGELWLGAGENYDAEGQEAVGQLLDEATERLDHEERVFAGVTA